MNQDAEFTQKSIANLENYGFNYSFVSDDIQNFKYSEEQLITTLPEMYLKDVDQQKLEYLKIPADGCSGAKYVALGGFSTRFLIGSFAKFSD